MLLPQPLICGKLIRRYKRFLTDVELDDGSVITAVCPNTGSMMGLTEPGTTVWLSTSDNPKRKYARTWELLRLDGPEIKAMVGINTNLPNKIVSEAIAGGAVPELAGYGTLRNEVKYGKNSRIDILLEDDARPRCYVEVKNVHLLREKGRAEFPDSVTARGKKHLVELADMVAEGARAVMFYLIQRDDAETFSLARDIDPDYASTFATARAAGVEVLVYCCKLGTSEIVLDKPVPFVGDNKA